MSDGVPGTGEFIAPPAVEVETKRPKEEKVKEEKVKEKKAHDTTWKKQGELIRSVQRVRAELTTEIETIVGTIAGSGDAR